MPRRFRATSLSAIDPENGALTEHGAPRVPPAGRIIHLSVDSAGGYLVLAHNQTSQVSTLRLAADGTLGEFVTQQQPASTGFFAHQALLEGQGRQIVACGLGAPASDTAPEQPGSLTVFDHAAGLLTHRQSVLLARGLGPRHLEYSEGRVFVAVERGNRLFVYNHVQGVLELEPSFDVSTLCDSERVRPGQRAGAIHRHPDGRHLYLSNRARETVTRETVTRETVTRETLSTNVGAQPVDVFVGGENNIALYEIDGRSGAPQLIDHYDTRGFEPRTFSIEPAGQFLFVGNQSARNVLHADGTLEPVSRSIAVFRIGHQGRLSYLRKYDLSGGELLWLGTVALPR